MLPLALALGWLVRSWVGSYGTPHNVALAAVCAAVVLGFLI